MLIVPGSRERRFLIAAIFLGLVLALGAARFDRYFRSPMLELGDIAVNALQVDHAKHLAEIYGNYSRFQFNHPGPAFFYVYAGAERVLFDWLHLVPSPANAHLLACLALQSLFFALAVGTLCSHLPWRAMAPLALLAAAWYFGRLGEPFVSIWPPHVLLMPFLCFLVACVSVASGRVRDWPLVVLAGGFLFHGHVAQPLFVGGLGGLALLLSLRSLRPATGHWCEVAREHRRTVAWCVGLIVIFLVPLAIDLVGDGRRSNLATIVGRFAANREESISAWKSLLYFLSFATDARDQETLFATIGPATKAFFAANAWRVLTWLLVLALPGIIALRLRTLLFAGERRFILTGSAFLFASVLGCIAWGKAQAGGMYHFNGYFYYAIYYFGLLLVLALVARGLQRLPRRPVVLLGGAAAVAAVVMMSRLFAIGRPGDAEAGLILQRGVAAALAADPDPRPKLLVFEHRHWHNVAAVALELERRGVGFYVVPWWDFMFHAQHDLTRLGPAPEGRTAIWWLTPPATDGTPITSEVGIHVTPAALRPDGGEIHLQGGANGFRYVVSGVTSANLDYATTDLPRTVFRFAPQPAARDVNVIFDAASEQQNTPEAAAIYFNNELLGTITARARGSVTVCIPAALWNRQPVGTLELRFPHAKAHRVRERASYEWWTAWLLWGLRFELAPP